MQVNTIPQLTSIPLPDNITQSNSINLSSKTGTILKMQSQVRKLKHIFSIQKQLHNNRQQLQTINQQISHCQQQLKSKRRQAMKQRIASIEKRKNEREYYNKQANNVLSKIKEGHKQRRLKMESIVNMYKEEYDLVYQKKLDKRKQQMGLDINSIRGSQSQYLKSVSKRRSHRVKTQNLDRIPEMSEVKSAHKYRYHQYSPSVNSHELKLVQKKELVKKGRQYGQFAEKAANNIKVTADMISKGKNYRGNHGFEVNIDMYEYQKKKLEKPKLNTNFSGNIAHQQTKQINKIAKQDSPVKQKLIRLSNLAQGYKIRYDNGHDEALEKMCNINLLRANIFLQDA